MKNRTVVLLTSTVSGIISALLALGQTHEPRTALIAGLLGFLAMFLILQTLKGRSTY